MKRFCAVALALCAVMTFSCKKEETRGSGEVTLSVKPLALESTEERVFEPGNFFTPDYTPYEPEAEDRAGKVNLTSPKSKGEKILNIIPGLRKLSAFCTSDDPACLWASCLLQRDEQPLWDVFPSSFQMLLRGVRRDIRCVSCRSFLFSCCLLLLPCQR